MASSTISKSSSSSGVSSSSSRKPTTTPHIVALPSLSSHLCSLPNAKSLESLPVHPTQSAQRHAESEAKLRKALERNVARQTASPAPQQYPPRSTYVPAPTYSEPSSPSRHSPPLMINVQSKLVNYRYR